MLRTKLQVPIFLAMQPLSLGTSSDIYRLSQTVLQKLKLLLQRVLLRQIKWEDRANGTM